jgi:hypothetical protein
MKIKVTEISLTELSDLISCAIYGNDYMGVNIKSKHWKMLVETKPELESVRYFEDKCAHLLLNNGCIYVTDMDAEEEVYGKLPHTIDAETGQVTYQVKLEDVLNGLSNKEVRWEVTNWDDMDLTSAYAIMQAITFGEVVYG